jgi:lysophospholipase L1-like esterase
MWNIVKIVLLNLVVLLLLVAIVEGAAGLLLFCMGVAESKGLAERLHTRYDPDLGWANIPNKRIPDFYAPGKEIKINGQGFRSDYDFSRSIPANKVRILVSGDSFTQGFGVSGRSTWVSLLTGYNHSIETMNMGQGGYGIDQMYLWYMRDGVKYDHDIHLFAFIGNDFRRMLRDNLVGYAKPYLKVENGSLVTCNTPVPRASYLLSWLTRNREVIKQLSTARLLARLSNRDDGGEEKVENKEQVVEAIFSNLARLNMEKGSTFVLVWLPNNNNAQFDDLRSGLHRLSEKKRWYFIDLSSEMERLSEEGKDRMFIPDDGNQPEFTGAAGHYSEEGNRIIAAALYKRLKDIPEIGRKLHRFR